ncbi:hypothetical protein BGX31_007225 [Mortierella sp. GBA43]|nr:hypothetical protein BGX31_007225 [Mortierella sp. GBA43]
MSTITTLSQRLHLEFAIQVSFRSLFFPGRLLELAGATTPGTLSASGPVCKGVTRQEPRRLQQLVRDHRVSAIDWCSVAKKYQQDRNFMALRLAELELRITKPTHLGEADRQRNHDPSKDTVLQGKQRLRDTDLDTKHSNDSTWMSTFVTQTISDILDHMAPPKPGQEPNLPTKGNNSNSGTKPPPSSLKSSSTCKCGCQEELAIWKSQCAYAENQVTRLEMQCERTSVMMEAYKAKWSHWKESVVREQYQRRMRSTVSSEASQYVAPDSPSNQQSRQRPQALNQLPVSTTVDADRTRVSTEESEGSRQRRETTERNTFFNRLNIVYPDSNHRPSPTSSKNAALQGVGSANEPHVIFDEKVRRLSLNDGGSESTDHPPIVHSKENDATSDSELQPMSPTFPSDFALHRRQYSTDDSEDDDAEYGLQSGLNASESVSPTIRALGNRNQRRTWATDRSTAHTRPSRHSLWTDTVEPNEGLSIRSDRSSPPIFESTDFQPAHSHSSKTKAGMQELMKEANGRSPAAGFRMVPSRAPNALHATDPQNAISPNQGKVSIPETSRDLQGSTTMKNNHPFRQGSSRSGSSVAARPRQRASGHEPQPQLPMADIIAVDDDEAQTQEPEHLSQSNKENKVPAREPLPEADLHVDEVMDGTSHPENMGPPDQPRNQRSTTTDTHAPDQRIYNFTERNRDKRKQMHGHDCACCRRFYELTGPLPLPDGYNAFFTPAPRPGEKEEWEKSAEDRLQDRIQQISRHRVHHENPLTPPGFWDTDFPPTPDRLEWDRIAGERRDRKKKRIEVEQKRQGRT